MKQEKTSQRNERKSVDMDDLLKNMDVGHQYRNLAYLDMAAGGDPLQPLYGAMAAQLYGFVDHLAKDGKLSYEAQFMKNIADNYARRAGYGVPEQENSPQKPYSAKPARSYAHK
jgi:hypothetical protein